MTSLLNEKELTTSEREAYGAILRAHLKKQNAAPNMLISLDEADAPEMARVQQIADRNPDTCKIVQLQEPVTLGPRQLKYARGLIACYCQQCPIPWRLKMDRSTYPQVDPAIIQDFQRKRPDLNKEITFVDFPAVGMTLRDFVREAARTKRELRDFEDFRVCFIDFECYTNFVVSEVGMAVVELSGEKPRTAKLLDKYHQFARFDKTLFKNGAPNWTSLKYVKKRVTGIPYDGQNELHALETAEIHK